MLRISTKKGLHGMLIDLAKPDSVTIDRGLSPNVFWDWVKAVTKPVGKSKKHISLRKTSPYWLVPRCRCKVEGYIEFKGSSLKFPYIENHRHSCKWYKDGWGER